MDLHFIIAFFIATFLSVQGVPLPSQSVYDAIKLSAEDVHFKCPYVRTTKLLEPEPKYLSNCTNFKAAQSLTTLDGSNIEDGLCLLYFDNFEHLCYASNNYTEITKGLLSNDQIKLIPVTYQSNVSQVCAILKNTQPFLKESKPAIEAVQTHLEHSRKCERICTDWDVNVKPICSLTAFMMNITAKLQDIQKVVPVDTKSEKAKNSKPPVTDHNAELRDNNKQVDGAIKKKTETGEQGIVTEKNVVEKTQNMLKEQGSGAEKNVPAQSPPETGSMPDADFQFKNSYEQRWQNSMDNPVANNINGEQSTPLKIQPSSKDALANSQGKKSEQQNITEKKGEVVLPTSAATPQSKVKTIKDESPNNAPEQKSEKPQVNSSPSTSNQNNNVVQKPSGVPLDEINGSKIESTFEVKPEGNKDSNDKPEENGGSVQGQSPLNNESPKQDKQEIGLPEVDNKLSTKVLGAVEAAGESPQDVKDQDYGEAESDPGFENGPEDYNINNEDQPKQSEVKTKLVEKSKPREIDEDGPSFAANYQNQSIDDSDSYFFSYFMMVCIMFICGYVAYHNKQKILALVVEGRKGRRTSRTRRPNSANYRKLDSNLEEAVTSSCNKNATQVIY